MHESSCLNADQISDGPCLGFRDFTVWIGTFGTCNILWHLQALDGLCSQLRFEDVRISCAVLVIEDLPKDQFLQVNLDDVRDSIEKQGAGQAMFRVKSWKVETGLGYEVKNQNRSITLSADVSRPSQDDCRKFKFYQSAIKPFNHIYSFEYDISGQLNFNYASPILHDPFNARLNYAELCECCLMSSELGKKTTVAVMKHEFSKR